MAVCTKGFTIETKTCAIPCTECDQWEEGNQRVRMQRAFAERLMYISEYLKTGAPKACAECELYKQETHDYMALCEFNRKPFEVLLNGKQHQKKDTCPFLGNQL